MQLKNDFESYAALFNTIHNYYINASQHNCKIFDDSSEKSLIELGYYISFLVDKKYPDRYSIGPSDRGTGFLGGLSLAIGPHFFIQQIFGITKMLSVLK